MRFLNMLFGVWLLVAPWVISGFVTGAQWNDVVAGVVLITLSVRRGHIRGRYGSWQPYLA